MARKFSIDSAQIRRVRDAFDAPFLGLHADNVTANAGSGGALFATDECTVNAISVHVPIGKTAWGALDTANLIDRASGKGLPIQGEALHDAATTGAPVLIGGEARTTDGTAVASGDAARVTLDTLGKVVVLQGATHDQQVNGSANFTSTTAADLIALVASTRIAITSIIVTNAHATVSTKVTIRDKTTTTRKIVGYALAAGGGFTLSAGGRPLLISDSGSAIEAVCGTTGSDIDVSVSGYKIIN